MKRINRLAVLAIAVALGAFTAGCSDGELQPSEPALNIAPPPPIVISFYASPEEIPSGGTTTITWEVANADSVEVMATAGGTPVDFHVESQELTDSAQATNLTATTDFTLTAKKAMAVPPAEGGGAPTSDVATPTESSVSQTITVRVIPASGLSVTASADSTNLTAGGKTILHWDVLPSDADVSVKDSSGVDVTPVFSGADCEGTDADLLLTNGTPTDGPEAQGCAVVDPAATTTYTVTATKDGESEGAPVTINVASSGAATADIQVSPQTVTSPNAEVTVTWNAAPIGAIVTVTAEPTAVCTPELPQNAAITAQTTVALCTLSSGNTRFTIQVKTSESATPVEDKADVTMSAATAGAEVDIVSDSWAFEGEEVSLTISPKTGTDRSSISEIRVSDGTQTKVVSGVPAEPVKVKVPAGGVTVTVVGSTGTAGEPRRVVQAISMAKDAVNSAYEVTELAFDPNGSDEKTRFTGVKMADYNGGKVKIYVNGSDDKVLDIETALESYFESVRDSSAGGAVSGLWGSSRFEEYSGALVTNAIAIRPGNSDEVYIGTSGTVMVSDDAGTTFSLLVPAYRTDPDYPGSHISCRGKEQKGFPEVNGQSFAFKQICAITVGEGGRFIAATDSGTYSISDVTKFRAKDPDVVVKGRDTPLHKKVTDALVCLDDDCANVFAGSEEGVYKSTNGGEAWEAFGTLNKKVFSLAVLGDKVYAGAEDGIYESSKTSASFSKAGLDGKKVYSLAVDENGGPFGMTVIAGTDGGVYVTRNSCATWSGVGSFGEGESLAVAMASQSTGSGAKVSVLIGTGNKAYAGEVEATSVSIDESPAGGVVGGAQGGTEQISTMLRWLKNIF